MRTNEVVNSNVPPLPHRRGTLIPALTTLRYFAAIAIVALHCGPLFGWPRNFARDWGAYGVMSFFFVLSGFVMAYNYPKLDTSLKRRGFYRLRLARIWPLHIATLVAAMLIVPTHLLFNAQPTLSLRAITLVLNGSLVQSWIPHPVLFGSYNEVSWSISTECFFYLCFPWISLLHRRAWNVALASFALCVALASLAFFLQWPSFDRAPTDWNATSLFHIWPATRLLEFVVGMMLANALSKEKTRERRRWLWTLLELAALLVFVVNLRASVLAASAVEAWGGPGLRAWIFHSGALPGSAFLIWVFARCAGSITRCLSHPFALALGESAFSVYLWHNIFILRMRDGGANPFAILPQHLQFPLFLAVLTFGSYLSWRYFEIPAKTFFLGRRQLPRDHQPPTLSA